jgi:hypothetical protein
MLPSYSISFCLATLLSSALPVSALNCLISKSPVLIYVEKNSDMTDTSAVGMIVHTKWLNAKISLIILALVNVLYCRKS